MIWQKKMASWVWPRRGGGGVLAAAVRPGRCSPRPFSDLQTDGEVSRGLLSGIRVLDMSRILAGPYCSMILGDLGAEIIKVERPGVGDDTRTWGPPFIGTESAYFLSVNRNKKSIAVDLKKPEGAQIIRKLACFSDVLLENYLPQKLTTFGLGYDQLKESAPHLIYCSITGYGQRGPYAHRPGYDVIVAGAGGLIHITGPQDGQPCKVGVAMTDLSTGLYAYGAILAAILHRQRTGRGQQIDCNLFSTQVASLVNIGSNYLNAGIEAQRYGTAHESIVPYQAFSTTDGYILIGAGNDAQFRALCKVLEMEAVSKDSRYATNKSRVANRQSLLDVLSKTFKSKTTEDWLEILDGCSFPYGPINNMSQVFSHPQVIQNGLIQGMDHPSAGHIRLPAPAVCYSDCRTVNPSPPPTLGQHTDSVLSNVLLMEREEIERLREKRVIQ